MDTVPTVTEKVAAGAEVTPAMSSVDGSPFRGTTFAVSDGVVAGLSQRETPDPVVLNKRHRPGPKPV
jgi:hypothetical protein